MEANSQFDSGARHGRNVCRFGLSGWRLPRKEMADAQARACFTVRLIDHRSNIGENSPAPMARKLPNPPPTEPREFRSPEEIDAAVARLERRVNEVEQLDVRAAIVKHTGADTVVISNVRETIREVFGSNSPEFKEHEHIRMWAGALYMNMDVDYVIQGTEHGCTHVVTVLNGLIARLQEKKADMLGGSAAAAAPSTYFDRLNLHPRIRDVSRDLFMDGHHWDAVFAASKALLNFVQERSGRHDLDGAALVREVFSRKSPILSFNDLSNQTEQDEQEGMMHLFEGAVLAIRNPGGHSFPEGSAQRAIEYISFLSLLAYRVEEAKRRKSP